MINNLKNQINNKHPQKTLIIIQIKEIKKYNKMILFFR